MKKSGLKLVSLALAAAALSPLAAQSVSAETMSIDISPQSYTLTLTEVDSTTLQLAYTGPGDGSSFLVTPTSPDNWTIQVLSQTITLNNFKYDFLEPENSLEVNEVSHNSYSSPDIFVKSDLPFIADSGYIGFITRIGSDGGVPIDLVFNDQAAAGETAAGVPDTGSSLTLLALALAALVGLGRIRPVRLCLARAA